MLCKTFDNIWEAVEVSHQFLFARLLLNQLTRSPDPPPLNMLRVPVHCLALLIGLAERLAMLTGLHKCTGACQNAREYLEKGFDFSSISTSKLRGGQYIHAYTCLI